MRVPTADELAAIAVAYLTVTRTATPEQPAMSPWRAAARVDGLTRVRGSLWRAAGRRP